MLSFWWSGAGAIHYGFIKPVSSMTDELCCSQMEEMTQKLTKILTRLFNISTPILLQDDCRPNTVKLTLAKLQNLELEEVFHHPPYSS